MRLFPLRRSTDAASDPPDLARTAQPGAAHGVASEFSSPVTAPPARFDQGAPRHGPPGQGAGDHVIANAESDFYVAEGWLHARNVQKSYKKRLVVRGVSLAVRRGESVGLLGPNGAGKTTVFYMITGLVPADNGHVFVDGRDVTALPMYRRARLGVGYLPQEASIFRGLTVEQNIMAVLEIVEPKRKARQEQLDQLLEEFKITRLRKSPSIALSGGERRRCEIARALASRPSFVLLDEPFAGIDPIAVGDIQQLVRHLTELGIGVLITDHNVRETLSLIDRAYIIYDGQVLTQGTPQDIINNEDVRRVYLGDMFA
ncbi:MAG: LPS export ABC transporter ATP-binding protein [Hyphomicrobiaceae bacterium]